MSDIVRTGGCHCGAVRYKVKDEPKVSGLCHCQKCRKLTGSVVSATANWPLSQFELTGEIRTYDKRSFCPTCGSRLFFLTDEEVEVFLGTLDEAPNGVAPAVEVWTIRREHWLPPVAGAILYDRNENSANG